MLPSAATLTGPPPANGHAIVSEATVSLSHRVLLHLYRQGIPGADEVAPRSHSQAGMMELLGARQGALAGVLRRLEAAGVVRVATTHVRGGERRVKVYMLTDRGLELAKEIGSDRPARSRSPPSVVKR